MTDFNKNKNNQNYNNDEDNLAANNSYSLTEDDKNKLVKKGNNQDPNQKLRRRKQ
jgi:hypothetical protein